MANVKGKPDYSLIAITGLLVLFGMIVLASASTYIPRPTFTESFHFLLHQLTVGVIPGIILGFLLLKSPIEKIKKIAPLLLLINLVLMVMVFLPVIGKKSGDASRWVDLGIISFQPSEFLKLTFILYLATWLESWEKKGLPRQGPRKENFISFIIILAAVAIFLIFQSDISTLLVIALTGCIMYFVTKPPLWHMAAICILGVIGIFLLIQWTPYRMNRILVFLDPERDPMGIGYQIKQSLIAVGSGKIFGLGLGLSKQKFSLPHPISDSIFALIAEETGFVGSLMLVLLFAMFLWKGFQAARNTNNIFSKLVFLGITSWIMIQAFFNIGSMINIMPLTGIPLPFISYGGTALFTELCAIGIMVNISRQG